jgi:hypothetical protein
VSKLDDLVMPRKKKNTDYLIGDEGIFPPIIAEFLENHAFPEEWGIGANKLKTAFFLARLAADPGCFERFEVGNTSYDCATYRERAMDLYAIAPDLFLEFMRFVRQKMKVDGYRAMACAFLREGAAQKFMEMHGQEPTDGELALMFKNKHNLILSAEHFGDARREISREDQAARTVLEGIYTI